LLAKIRKCDAVFTTANMFFDKQLFNPWHNFVFSLSWEIRPTSIAQDNFLQ
jgi:hypothetical protein